MAKRSERTTAEDAADLGFDHPVAEPVQPVAGERIHASECVINSECTLTKGCRGRLRQTNPIGGKVQIYCSKCHQFADGTRPMSGTFTSSGGKLFNRTGER